MAIASGRLDVARLLAKHGADPERKDNRGETVWDACDQQHRKACDDLRCFFRMYVKRPRITEL